MGSAAIQQDMFSSSEPDAENCAADHNSNVVGVFDGSVIPTKTVPTWLVHTPCPGAVPAAAGATPRAEFRHHTSPAIDRVTEFGNLLVRDVNALVDSAMRARLSFSLKLCPACIVDPGQAATLAFLMSEVLINARSYAHPTEGSIAIRIICAPGRNETTSDICDDGVGLPRDFEEFFDFQGVMLVRFRLQKVVAGVNFGADDLGLSYRVVLPPPVPRHVIIHPSILHLSLGVH